MDSPDLVLVAGWPKVFGPALLEVARVGTLNLHPSLLPEYRGRHPLFWAIVQGEREVGITVHHMSREIDAGPIVLQRAVAVPQNATPASLAHAVDARGAELIPEILLMMRNGKLPQGKTPTSAGSHFPPVRAKHGQLDWTLPSSEIERLYRACQGVVRPYTLFRGMKLVPRSLTLSVQTAAGSPGEIQRIGPDGISVAARPGSQAICIARWLFLEREYDALGLASLLSLEVGSRFGAS